METILIGIDGGATKVSAHLAAPNEKNIYRLTDISAEKLYESIPGFIPDFKPADLQLQLKEFREGEYSISADELQQGAVLIEACAQAVESITNRTKCRHVIIGIGMPGLKTADAKGVAVLANGPRMPHYVNDLEKRLAMSHIHFQRPIARLGSDADYCGIGENYAQGGLFKEVKNAYYIGLGTGAADALKLKDKLIPFDKTKNWIAKTWELKTNDGRAVESIVSARGIQNIYAEFSKRPISELNEKKIFADKIVSLADKGDTAARNCCRLFTETLSSLLLERISIIYSGKSGIFSFANPQRESLTEEHPYRSTLLDRIIIGQRIGMLMKSEQGKRQLTIPLMEQLKLKTAKTTALDDTAKRHYANLEHIIKFSNLREAPAIGAAIDALISRGNDHA